MGTVAGEGGGDAMEATSIGALLLQQQQQQQQLYLHPKLKLQHKEELK